MRSFDFSLFGDHFSVQVRPAQRLVRLTPRPAPEGVAWQAMSAGSAALDANYWSTADRVSALRVLPNKAQRLMSCVQSELAPCDDEGEISYRDDDYAVFEKLKAYDYQD